MNFLPIAPINDLHLLDNRTHVMILAHLLKNEDYLNYYKSTRYTRKWTLLDNGMAENAQITSDELIDLVDIIHPDCVVALDSIGNGPECLQKTKDFCEQIDKRYPQMQVMGVPHGKDQEEYLDCYQQMLEIPQITHIGISKFVSASFLGNKPPFESRCNCLYQLDVNRLLNRNKRIHLLGCNNPIEILYAKQFQAVETIDSCLPVLYGANKTNLNLDTSETTRIPTPEDYFEYPQFDLDQRSIARDNIYTIDELCFQIYK